MYKQYSINFTTKVAAAAAMIGHYLVIESDYIRIKKMCLKEFKQEYLSIKPKILT